MTNPAIKSKPLPVPDADSKPFWEACAKHELSLQRCGDCGAWRFPPSPLCPQCLSRAYAWQPAAGRGSVYSFVIVREAMDPAWKDDLPYVVAIIALEEGPHMLSNVVGIPVEQVHVGMPVAVCFARASGDIVLPKFQPAAG